MVQTLEQELGSKLGGFAGKGRRPFDSLWRRKTDFIDAYVVLQEGVKIEKDYRGPFSCKGYAQLFAIWMSLKHVPLRFHAAPVSNVTHAECWNIEPYIDLEECRNGLESGRDGFKTLLACIYARGWGVDRDVKLAKRYLKERIDLGDADAVFVEEFLGIWLIE